MVTARRVLVSEEEFLALPESMEKVELIDGEVFVAPSPNHVHQQIVVELVTVLNLWAKGSKEPFTVLAAPCDIRFRKNRILQPDICVFRGRIPKDAPMPLSEVPFLCIEVASSDGRYDRVTKRFVYADAQVEEYWVVEQMGLVERWTGPRLEASEEVTAMLTSPRLPGFAFDVAMLRD